MTSAASYGNATSAGNFTLVFSGGLLGSWVEGFTSVPRRSEIAERQNFWSTDTILDGSYPALTWDHEFTLYTEAGSVGGFMNSYFALANKFYSRSRPLRICWGTEVSSLRVDFGNCYMKPFSLENPSELLLHRAGMIKLAFVGTQTPTVIA